MTAAFDLAPHILIVDDDRRIRELLHTYLLSNGFRVSLAGHAGEARKAMRGLKFDLLVLDIMMPGESGLDLTRALRAESEAVPILMLSALADPEQRIAGLMTGSDDYLAKPFEPRELLLRIRSILKRARVHEAPPGEVRFGRFAFNLARGELRRDGKTVRLTTRERELPRLLAGRAGKAVGRAELAQAGADESARSVDVQINRLRQKVENDPSHPVHIQTVRGAGYALHLD